MPGKLYNHSHLGIAEPARHDAETVGAGKRSIYILYIVPVEIFDSSLQYYLAAVLSAIRTPVTASVSVFAIESIS